MSQILPIYSTNINRPYKTQKLYKPSFKANIRALFPWINNPTILKSLEELYKVEFDKNDVDYIKSFGIQLPFTGGKQAVEFLRRANVRIIFDKMPKDVHAQYDFDENFIKINNAYEHTNNLGEILAISEAILHEAGHAKDGDASSSVQEELSCLATNALAHRYLKKRYHQEFNTSNARIVNDGVNIYEILFFDKDPNKTALIARIKDKYGDLPAGDFIHPPSMLAFKIKGL